MDKLEIVRDILNLNEEDFNYGVAMVFANCRTVAELQEEGLLETEEAAPTVEECCSFVINNKNKDILLRLMVVDPNREDFRIKIKGVSINSEYAKVNTIEDMKFWKAFMDLGRKGAHMTENSDDVSWLW